MICCTPTDHVCNLNTKLNTLALPNSPICTNLPPLLPDHIFHNLLIGFQEAILENDTDELILYNDIYLKTLFRILPYSSLTAPKSALPWSSPCKSFNPLPALPLFPLLWLPPCPTLHLPATTYQRDIFFFPTAKLLNLREVDSRIVILCILLYICIESAVKENQGILLVCYQLGK